jgi:hypothetical protein
VARLATLMSKNDSFFIRASTDFDGTNYAQTAIDLGAYVDALGMSVLRIHGVTVRYGSIGSRPITTAGTQNAAGFQLTTQSQAALVDLTDKSLIASGILTVSAPVGGTGDQSVITESLDIAPQMFKNGYLVGVEQIYLGVDQSFNIFLTGSVQIILECTVEKLSSSAAMALALSQA